MALTLGKCPEGPDVASYRKRPIYNDALICGQPVYPFQKVWSFKEVKNMVGGGKTLTSDGGSTKVEITRVSGMKTYIGI